MGFLQQNAGMGWDGNVEPLGDPSPTGPIPTAFPTRNTGITHPGVTSAEFHGVTSSTIKFDPYAEGLVLAKNSHEVGMVLPTLGRANVLFQTDLYRFSCASSV